MKPSRIEKPSSNSTVLPEMVKVKQRLPALNVVNFVVAIKDELKKAGLHGSIKAGSRIAITAGSRGIAYYPEILATIVEEVKRAGGKPFLVPAMGSHGGATPEGQVKVLESLGVTPERVGAPIRSSMEVEEIGRLEDGTPVYTDRLALHSDGIIVVNRIKPHTDFKDKIESGLMKMMAIGLGKQKGAEMIHRHKAEGYHKILPMAARLVMERAPIILGLAIVENAYHEIAIVKALRPEVIEREEIKLLREAKRLLARIPFRDIDVLIIEEIGKDISGTGMDTNVVGRFWIPGEHEPLAPNIKRIVVLDLSERTHGNATGIGLADLTTRRLVEKIDYDSTFVNCLTSGWPEGCKIPVFLPNDREAIATAIRTCGPIDPREAKVVRIKNTLDLEKFWVSLSLVDDIKADRNLSERIKVISKPRKMMFDVLGNLLR
ncbi:TPA: DUF2088 domain-containing protein [Candidatus Bathyarchaeota archaeon]|nr:DUF2088 domain-containing protein [Candidatus Bathyarchaeota archaeon]